MKTGDDVSPDTETETNDSERDGRGTVPFAALVLFEAALAPLALLVGLVIGRPPLADFAWDPEAVVDGVLAALPMMVFLAATVLWPVGPFERIKAFFNRELAPTLRVCRVADLAILSVAAGIGEEMLFRGVIQGALATVLGPALGLAAASAIFGVLHPVTPTYVVIAALLGAYLGTVWIASGNLLTVMVAHAVYDFVALVVLLGERPAGSGDAAD